MCEGIELITSAAVQLASPAQHGEGESLQRTVSSNNSKDSNNNSFSLQTAYQLLSRGIAS